MPAGGGAASRGASHVIAKLVEKAGVRRSVWAVERAAKASARDAEKAVVKDALKRGETRAPKEILHDLEQSMVKRLSSGDKAAIKAFHAASADAEKSITGRIEKIGGERLAGKEFALKSEGSLERKVAEKVVIKGKPVDRALSEVKDSVRYTMKFSPNEYAHGAEDAIARMKSAGFSPVEIKNSWPNESGYRGINSVWHDPETGHLFEMQFHTEASLAAKEGTHPIYDFERLPGLDGGVRDTLGGLQENVFSRVPTPPGAAGVR
jgi:hypothetical protein